MRILVTGAVGFIGYHLCSRLLSEGEHEIIGVDSFNDYYDVRLKYMRSAELQKSGLEVKKLDLSDKDSCEIFLKDVKPDRVIHLAAQAGVRYSLENPHAYISSNITAFLNILEGCRHGGVDRLVYASSSSVYGGITEMPFHEEMNVDSPISLYASTKRSNELMAHTYSHLFGFQTVGLRFFTVYGPYGRPDMAMWLFTDSILNERPIKVFNHGKMKRDFTYVDDIVSGILGSTQNEISGKSQVYNLGNNNPEELSDFISILEQNLGKKAVRENMPIQPGDVPKTFASIDRAMADISFEPKIKLKDGIPKFTEWYLNQWLPNKDNIKV